MKLFDSILPSLICEALPPLPETRLEAPAELLAFAALAIPEQPMGVSRCSALSYAQILRQDGYDNPILLHLRAGEHDADSLKRRVQQARELGIRHFLVVQGDGMSGLGLSSAQALAQLTALALPGTSQGAVFDPHAPDAAKEEERLRKKLGAGASFIVTQPVLNNVQALACLERLDRIDLEMSVWLGLIDAPQRRPRLLAQLGLAAAEAEEATHIVRRLKNRCAGFYWVT